jgi:hypothetical protein
VYVISNLVLFATHPPIGSQTPLVFFLLYAVAVLPCRASSRAWLARSVVSQGGLR